MDGTRKYVWGANGIAYETDLTGNVQAVELTGGLGSVGALADNTGALVQTYRTDSFGVQTASPKARRPIGFRLRNISWRGTRSCAEVTVWVSAVVPESAIQRREHARRP